jgi:hypothetical protein
MSNTLWPAPVQIVLGCEIPHELDALKWKAIGIIIIRLTFLAQPIFVYILHMT